MSAAVRVCVTALFLALSALSAGAENDIPRTQYVLISFDGARDIPQWERSRALAEKVGARFTYFLSCVYLLSPQTKDIYRAPGKGVGKSNVGFAESTDDIRARLEQIWQAHREHHEIASHGCGHFDGGSWTTAEWKTEFRQFSRVLSGAWSINGLDGEPAGWSDFARTAVTGFRAPYLATGPGLYNALADRGFAYDASGISRAPAEPVADGGLVNFALPQIPEGPSERRVIAMDYNLFVRHSAGIDVADTDQVFENRAYEAFSNAFRKQYRGERIPLQIGFHFSLMNGGAYWRALERFAEDACVKPGVVCTSYSEYLRLTGTGVPSPAGG